MNRKIIICIALVLLTSMPSRALAQGPIVIDAVDDDSENRLWNCETNRVPFDNQETDRSRCFTFRYPIPPEGITSATAHIALDTLGSLQDTDATIVAVDKPVENCAWGQGNMQGCVVLHGGFKGGEKSLNLNLLNITCDPSIPNTEASQELVRQALESGVLHMELQDDTAVYGAQLVLNGGAPGFICGTSSEQVTTFVPTPGSVTLPTVVTALTVPTLVSSNPASVVAAANNGGTTPNNPVSFLNQGAFLASANEFLTGTPNPSPPNLPGAAAATVASAVALTILAVSNYLLSNGRYVQSALQKAMRLESSTSSALMAGDESAGTRSREHSRGAQREVTLASETSRDSASARAGGAPMTSSGASGAANQSARIQGDADAKAAAPRLDATGGVGLGGQGSAGANEVGAVALDKAVEEGIGSLPDLSDLIKDKLIEKAEKREQREILQVEKKRLEEIITTQEQRLEETREALKRVIDAGGDFDAAERAWRQAEHNLAQTRPALERVVKRLTALEAKPEDKEE